MYYITHYAKREARMPHSRGPEPPRKEPTRLPERPHIEDPQISPLARSMRNMILLAFRDTKMKTHDIIYARYVIMILT